MNYLSSIFILIFSLGLCLVPFENNYAGITNFTTFSDTDANDINDSFSLFYFFDLRGRETFIQLTMANTLNTGSQGVDIALAHIQIFDVSNNCNENDFTDVYTVNDTHIYNLRDIQTNDGNPSGVELPDGAYGIVAATMVSTRGGGQIFFNFQPIGNLRIIDSNGYEYRTNAQKIGLFFPRQFLAQNQSIFYSFNFNEIGGVSFSDIIGITLFGKEDPIFLREWIAEPVQAIFSPFDIDIVNNNETIFSCRDIIYSCVDDDNPLLETLLSIAQIASVASFDYGINDVIPNSKGGELLCPGNNIKEGTVILRPESYPQKQEFADLIESLDAIGPIFFGYAGLNNGNGRGSFDSFWNVNGCSNDFIGIVCD